MCLWLQLHSKSEGYFRESGSIFQRALALYALKFPKTGTASLTDLPEPRLGLLDLRFGLPGLCLSNKSGSDGNGSANANHFRLQGAVYSPPPLTITTQCTTLIKMLKR